MSKTPKAPREAPGKVPGKVLGPCPICKEAGTAKFKPFCSRRCADIDLGRWFNESYTVPAVEPPDEWDMPKVGPDENADEKDDNGPSSLLH